MVKNKIGESYFTATGEEIDTIKLGCNDNGEVPRVYLYINGKTFTDGFGVGDYSMPKEIVTAIDAIAIIQLIEYNIKSDKTYKFNISQYKDALDDISRFLGCTLLCDKDGKTIKIANDNQNNIER